MKMRRVLTEVLLGLVMLGCGVRAMAQQASFNGLFYAAEFGKWTMPAGQGGAFSWFGSGVCSVSAGGLQIKPFVVGTPVKIMDANPALNEVVTPSQVNYNGASCSVTFTPAPQYTHHSYNVSSATAGLQEAINYAQQYSANGNYPQSVIVLTPAWTALGGTTAMITSAVGTTNVSIEDQRSGLSQAYLWNGTAYVATSLGTSGLPDPGSNGLVKRTGANATAAAVPGTDYVLPSGTVAHAQNLPADFATQSAASPQPGTFSTVAVGTTVSGSLNAVALQGLTLNGFGDSIMYGVGASPTSASWYNTLISAKNWVASNNARSGDSVYDQSLQKIYPFSTTSSSVSVLSLGTNDTNNIGAGSSDWIAAYEAALIHLATQASRKLYASSSAVALTGTWADDDVWTGGKKATANGSTLTAGVFGSSMAVIFGADNGASVTATITIDGTLYSTVSPKTHYTGNGGNGVTQSMYASIASGFTAGPHTIVVTCTACTSSPLRVLYVVGNNNQVTASGPFVVATNFYTTYTCNPYILSAVNAVAQMGLGVAYADIASACYSGAPGSAGGQVTDLCNKYDGIHPDNSGHAIIEAAVANEFQLFEDYQARQAARLSLVPGSPLGSDLTSGRDLWFTSRVGANKVQLFDDGSWSHLRGYSGSGLYIDGYANVVFGVTGSQTFTGTGFSFQPNNPNSAAQMYLHYNNAGNDYYGILQPPVLAASGAYWTLPSVGGTLALSNGGVSAWGDATLTSGTVTVTNSAACTPSATCIYKLTNCFGNGSTGIGTLSVGGPVSVGSSFVISSLGPTGAVLTTDQSNVCWQIN